jgi:hypothetical protein
MYNAMYIYHERERERKKEKENKRMEERRGERGRVIYFSARNDKWRRERDIAIREREREKLKSDR